MCLTSACRNMECIDFNSCYDHRGKLVPPLGLCYMLRCSLRANISGSIGDAPNGCGSSQLSLEGMCHGCPCANGTAYELNTFLQIIGFLIVKKVAESYSSNSPVPGKTTLGAVIGKWTWGTSILRTFFFRSSQMSLNPWKDWPSSKYLELIPVVEHEVKLRDEVSLSVHSLETFCLRASGMACLMFTECWISLRPARKRSFT